MSERPTLRCVLCAAIAIALAAFTLLVDAGVVRADEKEDRKRQKQEEQRKKRMEKERGPTADGVLGRTDKDGDGKISKEEYLREAYEKNGGKMAGKRAKGADKDMDGELSFEEFSQLPPANDRFKKLDKDGSGFLERPEVETMAADLGREQRKRLPEFLRRYDDDGDGKVAREEFSGPDPVFARLDRNGDGAIDGKDEPEGTPPPSAPAPETTPSGGTLRQGK